MPYFTKPRRSLRPTSWWDHGADHDTSSVQSLGQPHVYDAGPVDIGIVDAHGNPIFRAPNAIGFYEKDEKP